MILRAKKAGQILVGADIISIEQLQALADDVYKVTITKPRKKQAVPQEIRRLAQNKLYWQTLTDFERSQVNEIAGHTQDEWHRECKKRFLYPIYVRDDKKRGGKTFAAMAAALQVVYQTCGKTQHDVLYYNMIELLSTTQATVAQFSEYLNAILHFGRSHGVAFRIDVGLYELAMEEAWRH